MPRSQMVAMQGCLKALGSAPVKQATRRVVCGLAGAENEDDERNKAQKRRREAMEFELSQLDAACERHAKYIARG